MQIEELGDYEDDWDVILLLYFLGPALNARPRSTFPVSRFEARAHTLSACPRRNESA